MANSVSVSAKGFDEIDSLFDELDLVAQKKVLRKAVREGAQPALADAKSGVSSRWGERSGVLHDSVKLRVTVPKNKKWADAVASIGIFRIRPLEELAKAYYPDGYIGAPLLAYWFEFGVSPHSLAKRSRAGSAERQSKGQDAGAMHPGMPARPVIRPSLDNNVEIITTRTANVLKAAIDKISKK
ncbi:hypothetical protein VPHK394_0008 [Vibrio phage K394]